MVIGWYYFFPPKIDGLVIICIDLFVVFFYGVGEEGADFFFFNIR